MLYINGSIYYFAYLPEEKRKARDEILFFENNEKLD